MPVSDRKSAVLKRKQTRITRAVMWRIPHDTKPEEVSLKVGRYEMPKNFEDDFAPESLNPKSELTLDHEELTTLIAFIKENYEPFRHGVKAFIPLDKPFDSANAEQIKKLFALPDKAKLVKFILENKIIPDDLGTALENTIRVAAIKQFAQMLEGNAPEAAWQDWFEKNDWVLGSDFVRVLDERAIDTRRISDFLMEAYDGFLDVVEIKKPASSLEFWAKNLDHGNYVPSSDLTKAITQASRYLYEVERESNSVKFLERMDGIRTVKPRCVLVFGRSSGWNAEQGEAYRILNATFHNLTVLSYDHVLRRAKRMIGMQ